MQRTHRKSDKNNQTRIMRKLFIEINLNSMFKYLLIF